MAVYDRAYQPYEGLYSRRRTRWLAIGRAAVREIGESRLYTLVVATCLLPPLALAGNLYLRHNVAAMMQLGLESSGLGEVDAAFFLRFLVVQSGLTYVLALLIGPGLVAGDLADGALPLYLSRPLSRAEYILGKSAALVALLSLATWLPGIALVALQTSLAGFGWLAAHVRVVPAILAGSALWILVLALLSLAVSAWVRKRLPARILLLALFYVPAGFGAALNEVVHTRWASLLSIDALVQTAWRTLLGVPASRAATTGLLGGAQGTDVPPWLAWLALAAICTLCLAMLHVKLRAYVVVRS